MYGDISSDVNLVTHCPGFSLSSPPPIPVTSFVFALLMWPWSEPLQGPGADENLKQASRKCRLAVNQSSSLNHPTASYLHQEKWSDD